MNLNEAMTALAQAGTAQNLKIYARHGVGENMFGVSYANLKAMAKQCKTDQPLAEALWATGNHDARILATMIADPEAVPAKVIDQWAKDVNNYVVTDAMAGVVSRSSFAGSRMDKWQKSKAEWLGRAGWMILANLAMHDETLPDKFFTPYLSTIEHEIHGQRNFVRAAMNSALIAIGVRNDKLEKQALVVAGKIGKVAVDHGETGCKTPDAADYIRKVREGRLRRHIGNVRKQTA